MSETITTAGAASPGAASPAVPTENERIARAAAAAFAPGSPPQPETPDKSAPAAPAPAAHPAESGQPSLAEVIRANREARPQAQAEAHKRSSIEAELKAAREELARAKADRQAFEDDPVGYAKERGWSKEQQLLYGQSLLYDLAPDKADPDFRLKMFEDRQKRREASEEKAAKEAEEKAAVQAQQAQFTKFVNDTAAVVRTFEAGSYPESEAWFEGDFESYMRSVLATANNIAAQATREGRVADLSAAALARALETEVAAKMARRDQRKQPRTAPEAKQTPAQPAGGQQTTIDTLSTRNMTGSGAPQPPATSEKERIQRAVAAAFPNR